MSTCVGYAVRLSTSASLCRTAALHRRVRPAVLGAHRSKPAALYPVRAVALLARSSHTIPHVQSVVGRDPRRTVAGLD